MEINLRQIIKEELTKLYEEKNPKKNKILYLHGLGSTPKKDGISVLPEEYSIVSPQLDYTNKSTWGRIEELISKHKPVAIVGHSFGGYLAYYLSNKNHIPALMFNPAFKNKEKNLLIIKSSIKKISPYSKQMAIVGMADNVSKPEDQIKQLSKGNCVIIKEDFGHDISRSILSKYFKKFKNKFLK